MTKLARVRGLMALGDWREATLLAAKFSQLGAQKTAIHSAREAYLRPEFQRQIGRDVEVLKEAGKEALKERFGNV